MKFIEYVSMLIDKREINNAEFIFNIKICFKINSVE